MWVQFPILWTLLLGVYSLLSISFWRSILSSHSIPKILFCEVNKKKFENKKGKKSEFLWKSEIEFWFFFSKRFDASDKVYFLHHFMIRNSTNHVPTKNWFAIRKVERIFIFYDSIYQLIKLAFHSVLDCFYLLADFESHITYNTSIDLKNQSTQECWEPSEQAKKKSKTKENTKIGFVSFWSVKRKISDRIDWKFVNEKKKEVIANIEHWVNIFESAARVAKQIDWCWWILCFRTMPNWLKIKIIIRWFETN